MGIPGMSLKPTILLQISIHGTCAWIPEQCFMQSYVAGSGGQRGVPWQFLRVSRLAWASGLESSNPSAQESGLLLAGLGGSGLLLGGLG